MLTPIGENEPTVFALPALHQYRIVNDFRPQPTAGSPIKAALQRKLGIGNVGLKA